MKILLVTSLFPPDKGVSTLRMEFFHSKLSEHHQVDVLKLGESTNLDGPIKTIINLFFTSLITTLRHRSNIFSTLEKILPNYDLVIVSAPPYNIYEIAYAAHRLGIRFIIDLRDQPDLVYSELKSTSNHLVLRSKEFLTNYYINRISRKAAFVSCVGGISSAITQKHLAKSTTSVINVHNGFQEKDIYLTKSISIPRSPNSDQLVIGCVGSLHRFRSTPDLHQTLRTLNSFSRKVVFKHWGTLCKDIADTISFLHNIEYLKLPPIPRQDLIHELAQVDAFLLPCSDDLIWEPTTSVFDYILFDKPVIFCGLRNNEAFAILQTVGQKIVTRESIPRLDAIVASHSEKSEEKTKIYSRENSFLRFINSMQSLENE